MIAQLQKPHGAAHDALNGGRMASGGHDDGGAIVRHAIIVGVDHAHCGGDDGMGSGGKHDGVSFPWRPVAPLKGKITGLMQISSLICTYLCEAAAYQKTAENLGFWGQICKYVRGKEKN